MSTKKNERGNAVTPTSTAAQSRVALYQPSQRPTLRTGEWIETSYGRCRVTGRLGQRHADVIDAIMHCAEKQRSVSDGGAELLVDPARVRRALSDSGYSHEQLWVLLKECMSAVIEIKTPKFRALGHLIDSVTESTATRPDPLTGGERTLWRVRLGEAFVTMLKDDLWVYYDPAPIARLKCGISQAVARHVLSHSAEPRGGWYVDTLITAVAGEVSGTAMRNARRYLQEDAEELRAMGITFEGGKVRKGVVQPPDDGEGDAEGEGRVPAAR